MKKLFGIALTLCLLVSAPVYSQFNWGIKAGMNLNEKPKSLEDIKTKSKNGFFAGPTAKVIIPVLNIGLEGSLLYSQSESEFNGKGITRRSIEVPVNLRYDFALPVLNKVVEPFIAVGPQFGWVIGGNDITIKDAANDVYNWEYKKSNFSLNVGAGATLLNHIQLHINYNIALGNTGEWKSNAASAGWDYLKEDKTNTWQISAAYIF